MVSRLPSSSVVRRARTAADTSPLAVEKDQTRLHVPQVDRTFGGTAGQGGKEVEGEVPPVIIAVIGPAGVSGDTHSRAASKQD